MYKGKSCEIAKREHDWYVYRDAFLVALKNGKEMEQAIKLMLGQAKRRVEDLEEISRLLQQDRTQGAPPPVKVKRYPPGATGNPAAVAAGAPPPVPIQEKKARKKR